MKKSTCHTCLLRLPKLLSLSGLISAKEATASSYDTEQLYGDGSTRSFYRIRLRGKAVCIAVVPSFNEGYNIAEARAAFSIGRHLHERQVPVPEIFGWDEECGLLLFEDLGDTRLHDAMQVELSDVLLRSWYHETIMQLIHMQKEGARRFDASWCWDSPRYDENVMVERESRYFLNAFWREILKRDEPPGLAAEFNEIANIIQRGGMSVVFLHRDFQSRNIMLDGGRVRFIDFQGGRLGPPEYDLASLLIDPYASLSLDFQLEMIDFYCNALSGDPAFDLATFRCRYAFLALQRNLQIVGAFSFLSRIREKKFFEKFILPSLSMLQARLAGPEFASFPVLRRVVDESVSAMKV